MKAKKNIKIFEILCTDFSATKSKTPNYTCFLIVGNTVSGVSISTMLWLDESDGKSISITGEFAEAGENSPSSFFPNGMSIAEESFASKASEFPADADCCFCATFDVRYSEMSVTCFGSNCGSSWLQSARSKTANSSALNVRKRSLKIENFF